MDKRQDFCQGEHYSNASADTERDSRERAKYKGLGDIITSTHLVQNLRLMYDTLVELSDLSRQFQKRETTLLDANILLVHLHKANMACSGKSFKGIE